MAQNLTGYILKGTNSHYQGHRLLKCARTLTRDDTESARVSTAGKCSTLSREWLENRTMMPGFAYVTGTVKDLQFQSPMQVNSTPFRIRIPGLLGSGSSVDAYFSTFTATTTLYMNLLMNTEDVVLKTAIRYGHQRIRFDHKVGGVWQKDFVNADVFLTVNSTYKLTLKPFENVVKVYLDETLVTNYFHQDNPYTTRDAVKVSFHSNPGSASLHRITIVVSS